MRDELISVVLEQIEQDIQGGQTDALYALLMDVPAKILEKFLPKESLDFLSAQ